MPAPADPAAGHPYDYDGPDTLRPAVEDALRRVVDPEVAMSIVDVGLVYGVRVADQQVQVTMTMTSAACPVTDVIVNDVESELDRVLPTGLTIHVDLVWQPAWTTDRMSPRAKAFMGW